jgi:hypothetical protein
MRCAAAGYNAARMQPSIRPAVVAVVAILAAACASTPSAPSPAGSKVSEGDPAVLNRECKLLGTVNGRSLFGGPDDTRVQNAMNDARDKAAAMGGTHVIFIASDTSGMLNTGHAAARVYRCDKPI